MPKIMTKAKVEVLTVSAIRPRLLSDERSVHVPATTQRMGQRHLTRTAVLSSARPPARVLPRGATFTPATVWGWWRSDDATTKNHDLVARWTDLGAAFIVDLEPDAWPTFRGLGPNESRAVVISAGVTSWGDPRQVRRALEPFAEAGKRGLIQMYRDGADPASAAVRASSRIAIWRSLGFTHLTGVLGGSRSGMRWNEAVLKVCEEEGVGVALWGHDDVARKTARLAFARGLGRG